LNIVGFGKLLKEVIKWGPPVSLAGKKIYENVKNMFGEKKTVRVKTDIPPGNEGIEMRISQLEQNDLDQAKLISQITEQTSNLSQLIKVLSRRIIYIFILSLTAFAISLFILIKSC
jgi:hypothetical protein